MGRWLHTTLCCSTTALAHLDPRPSQPPRASTLTPFLSLEQGWIYSECKRMKRKPTGKTMTETARLERQTAGGGQPRAKGGQLVEWVRIRQMSPNGRSGDGLETSSGSITKVCSLSGVQLCTLPLCKHRWWRASSLHADVDNYRRAQINSWTASMSQHADSAATVKRCRKHSA